MKAKRLLGLCMGLVLVLGVNMPVSAAEALSGNKAELVTVQEETAALAGQTANRPYLALGADLTPEQRTAVLALMGLKEADLANCTVLTITNEQERQYLEHYVSPSIIGTKSLSSVLVKQAEFGHGVVVTAKNISYCTTGMYRNALLTAGVENADILVVGPVPISGTAGLIGALKAYEQMSGQNISEKTLDTALNELVMTGELAAAAKSVDSKEVESLVAFIKEKLANGDLKTDEDIRKALDEGEVKFGVSLSEEEVLKVIAVMNKIEELGLDPKVLLEQARELYNKYGDEILKNADKAAEEMISSAMHSFFKNLGKSITDFFRDLFV